MSAARKLVLAFDASCGRCREVSGAVAGASGGRLEVLPLDNDAVRAWRGADAPWEPTLIRVDGDDVRVWTGRAMAWRLARELGPRATARVLRALGDVGAPRENTLGRKQFLRLAGGVAVAVGLVATGRAAAFADTRSAADEWVEANLDRLPRHYDQVAALPVDHRRAVFAKAGPELRTRWWLDHFARFRADRALTGAQAAVVDRAEAVAPRAFAGRKEAVAGELDALKADAIAAFGAHEARLLLATLGPVGQAALPRDCDCSNYSDWCSGSTGCTNWPIGCVRQEDGCGTLYLWACDGVCQ
ncbi:bacteriocin fulvocin C-related protein [Actinosynnema sp. NPDC020468]|uniref:bacteriocin fulvocin C-related protein n=1 Tax=Actinosynnema sp. NPDC020468 TaxID=3154488 RepID=UPI0033EFB360